MQSTGGWDIPEPPPPSLPRGVETGLMELRKSRKRGGSQKSKVPEAETSLNPSPLPKRVETGLMGLRKSRKRGGSRECKVREVGHPWISLPSQRESKQGWWDWGSQEKEAQAGNAKYGRLGHPWRPPHPPPKKSTVCLTKILLSCRRWEIAQCYFVQWLVILD